MTKRLLLKKAFKILRRNYGCPGNDGISISTVKKDFNFYEESIWEKVKDGSYEFEEVPKKVFIKDYLGNDREIFVYNVFDRWVQEFLRLQIDEVVGGALADYVYAFRRKRSDLQSYEYVLRNTPKLILRLDIKDYFRSINRESIVSCLVGLDIEEEVLVLIKKSLAHAPRGLPPGNVLSCVLSNLSLKDFDSLFPSNYARYSDDMLFGFENIKQVEVFIEGIEDILKTYGFRLNSGKIKIIADPTLEKLL